MRGRQRLGSLSNCLLCLYKAPVTAVLLFFSTGSMARRPPSASSRADAGDLSLQNGSKSDAEEATSTKILRATSLLCSFLVALSAGSNYGFSSYSPQLQERLALTSTQINIVGVMGNVGVYLSGPFWGRLVDKRGPKV